MATRIAAERATNKAQKVAARKTKIVKTMTKSRKKRVPAPTKRALDVFEGPSSTDVNGSYTGVPKNRHETPVQDADDL